MRLAVGLRRNSRWPKKKKLTVKRKFYPRKQKSQDFVSRLSLVLVPRRVRFAPIRSLFLCVNRATVFELIILVPRARDPSGLHQGSRTLTVPNFWALAWTCTEFLFCIFKPIRFFRFNNECESRTCGVGGGKRSRFLAQSRRIELLFASVWKWIYVRSHSYENAFHLHVHFHANQTSFSCKSNQINNLVLNLRQKATRRWPIDLLRLGDLLPHLLTIWFSNSRVYMNE